MYHAKILDVMVHLWVKGTTINDLGGAGGNREKKISEAILQEKINLKRPSLGKNKSQKAFPKKKFSKGISTEKINPFSIFPPAPPPDH